MHGSQPMLSFRTLVLSLLLTIIIGSVGSGLLLDKLYAELAVHERSNNALTQPQLEAIGAQLSATLRQLDNKEAFLQAWQNENSLLALEIINRDDSRIPAPLLSELERTGHINLSSKTYRSYYALLKETDGYLVIRSPISSHQQPVWLPILFTLIFYLLLLVVVLAWIFSLIRRLQTLQMSAKKLGEGDLGARITPSAASHIKDIELEFNRMAQRIEDLVADISLLSSAASHELRAPLTKLQFGLDALREEDNEETRQVYHDRLDKVIDDIANLIDTLLKYARLDKNIAQLPQEEVDLLEICKRLTSAVPQAKNSANNYTANDIIHIILSAESPFYIVKGDAFYLSLLVDNLLSNAIKYGRGEIQLGLQQQDDKTLLTIEDNGPGIAEHFKQDIFKPFMRAEKSAHVNNIAQGTSPKGYGLGMALVKRIADLHCATIGISSSETLGGAKITLVFYP